MAIDEAIFRANQHLSSSPPTLRFFGWFPPAVSIGYFQNFDRDINIEACASAGIDVVRRITGGRAVFHQSEVTYSITGREEDRTFPPGILGRYLAISRCILKGLEHFGVRAELESSSRAGLGAGPDPFCFSVPSQYELLVGGRKICGSAQARANGSFLQHGSILLDLDIALLCRLMSPYDIRSVSMQDLKEREKYILESVTCLKWESKEKANPVGICNSIKAAVEQSFSIRLEEGELTQEENILKDDLVRTKYRNDNWNRKGERPSRDLNDLC